MKRNKWEDVLYKNTCTIEGGVIDLKLNVGDAYLLRTAFIK
jgi:hypothetical protein